jgi:amidase
MSLKSNTSVSNASLPPPAGKGREGGVLVASIVAGNAPSLALPRGTGEGIRDVNVSRRKFIGATAAASTVFSIARFSNQAYAAVGDDFISKSATEIARMIKAKEITAGEAVKRFYARIDLVNPKLDAVVMFCRERALSEAQEADAMLAMGKSKGPLHGVPFTIKDSFDTAGLVSTGGTLGRKTYIPGKDATIAARVRAAGGILLGKTNTPEFTLGGGGKGTVNLV